MDKNQLVTSFVSVVDRHPDPDTTAVHFVADPDPEPDPAPSFTQVGTSEFF
jgi:hypothetical protein